MGHVANKPLEIQFLDEIRRVTTVFERVDGFEIENMRIFNGDGRDVIVPQRFIQDSEETIVVVASGFVVIPRMEPPADEAKRYIFKLHDGLRRAGVLHD